MLTDRQTNELTGYPSIDKPWLKYYTQEQIKAELPKCKIYDYVWDSNKDYQNRIALDYFDRKITYSQLFDGIEKAAKAFQSQGVVVGDVVCLLTVTLPEAIYSFYGLNRIGAISNMIDPRTSVDGIRAYIEEVKANTIVVIDAAFEKVIEAVNGTDVKHIVIISPSDSLPFPKNMLYKLFKAPRIKLDNRCMRWDQFIIKGNGQKVTDTHYEPNQCCVIVHTGGTTGTPKGVMLTNDNLNCSAFQCYNTSIDFQREHNWLDIMPPFIAYGVGNGLHLPLVTGAEVALIPAFDPDKFDELLIKYKPVHMVGVPSHYEKIVSSPKMKDQDLSYIIAPVVGGDSIQKELEEKVNEFFAGHNCKWNLVKGYGMTEVSAAVSVCVSNESNKIGGVGIPFAHTVISIFDTETGEELTYNQKGEICMTGPNTMIGYFNNEDETNKILRQHEDGLIWVHSGDLGYMDEDGQLFVEGRIKRMIVRHDGFKVYPGSIEKAIQRIPSVGACCVVGQDDDAHAQGKVPVAFVVLKGGVKKNASEVYSEIKNICNVELPEYAQPVEVNFIDSLPLTPIGKIDYMSLERN